MRQYISENGTDSNQCGQTAETACKTMTPLLKQSHRDNSFVNPDLLDQLENVWDQLLNQFRAAFNYTERLLNSLYPPSILPLHHIQVCTKERTVDHDLFDDTCNLIKDIYFSRIISHEDREYFNSSVDTYCIHRRNLYVKRVSINCNNHTAIVWPIYDHFVDLAHSIDMIKETKDEMISKLKSINIDIVTVTNIKMNNEVFPSVGPYHFHYHFIPTSSRIIQIDILNNTFHNLHLYLDNCRMSAHIKDNVFMKAGIKISSTHTNTHHPVSVENNLFQGDNTETILEVRDTTSINIFSCVFKKSHLFVRPIMETKTRSAMLCHNSQVEMHDIMFKNVSFGPVVAFQNCTLSIHNITMFKNNLSRFKSADRSLMHIKYSEGTIENIKFEQNKWTFGFWVSSGNITFKNMIATANEDVNVGRVEQSNINLHNTSIFNNTGSFFDLFQSAMNISSCILKQNNNSHRTFHYIWKQLCFYY